jgi:hypothetical protein
LRFFLLQVFREHSIDGSALMELTEQHMTGILNMKLGPAIRMRNAIRDLQTGSRSRLDSSRSSMSSPNTSSTFSG